MRKCEIKEIKSDIEKSAKEANCTEIQIISKMQGICASLGDEKHIEILCSIKSDYINAMFN